MDLVNEFIVYTVLPAALVRILVYGAGVLGCNLANNLYHAKKDVTLLARGVWAKQLKKAAYI